MARSVHIFIGDKVKTPIGSGRVEEVYTWRDRVIEMTDYEATEFSETCKRETGTAYRDLWCEVFVRVGNRRHRFLSNQVTIQEGRDVEPNDVR